MILSKMALSPVSAALPHAAPRSPARGEEASSAPSFLGSLNPLHHVPVVSAIYEKISGTKALPGVRILVAGALGGPLGFVAALADALLEEATGRTAGGHLVAAVAGEPEPAATIGAALPGGGGVPPSPLLGAEADRQGPKFTGARSLGDAPPSERDPRTARDLARTYLFDLALRHSLTPLDLETGAEQS